jgi:hypothetical protein
MKTTIVVAAVLALVTVLPTGLAVHPLLLPTSVQEPQENRCATEDDDFPEGVVVDENGECKYIGNLDIE